MSSFKPTQTRFSSLKDDVNTFSRPNNRDNRDNRYDTRRTSYKESRSFTGRDTKPRPKEFNITKDSYPSLSKEVTVDENKVVDKVPEVSDYLKKCAKTKEAAEKSKSDEGWITIHCDKKTHKVTYTRNGESFSPIEDYAMRREKLREQEYQADMEKLMINNIKRDDDLIREEYELYGDDSIVYQEHCRFQQYLIDYPDVDDDNLIDNDGSDYDSNEEY